MALPADGHKGYIQIGKAATWGTSVAATQKLDLLEEDIELDTDVIEDESLWADDNPRAQILGSYFAKGSFTVKATFEGILELIRGVLPTYSSAVVETGVRDHTMKSGGLHPFYTVQVVKGNVPAGKCWQLNTAKFVNLRLEGSHATGMAGIVKARVGLIGRDVDFNATPTAALTFPPFLPVKFDMRTVADDGTADASTDVLIRSWTLEIDNPHTDRERLNGAYIIDEPVRKGRLSAIWTLTQEFMTRTQLDLMKAGTSGSPRLVYQHPTTIGVTSKREFEVRSGDAKLLSVSVPTPGPNVLIATSVWRGSYDATDLCAVLARVRNTEVALP